MIVVEDNSCKKTKQNIANARLKQHWCKAVRHNCKPTLGTSVFTLELAHVHHITEHKGLVIKLAVQAEMLLNAMLEVQATRPTATIV